VSASLPADEVLLSLVDADRLAAISHRADDETVSNLVGLSELDGIERLPAEPAAADIAAFDPDLVIVPDGTESSVVDDLRGQGVTVYVYTAPLTLAELDAAIETLGRLVGEPARAAGLIDGVAARIAEIQRQVGEVPEELPAVVYYAGEGRVAGRNTVPDQIIQLAGGVNVAPLDGWGVIDDAELVALNPAYIITPPGDIDNELEDDPRYVDIQAVQDNLVLPISDPEMLAQSQYMVRGVAAVAKFLYPDRVSD
jgi:iron complex transport system substrate-binding protein